MKKKVLFLTVLLATVLLVGCGNKYERKEVGATQAQTSQAQMAKEPLTTEQNPQIQPQEQQTQNLSSQEETAAQTEFVQNQPETQETEVQETQPEPAAFSFSDVADLEFYFSSGAGAWYTVLYIHEDGTFDGHFQDSNMGDTGPEYPNGSIYYSEYSGVFTKPQKVNDTTYVFKIESLDYPLGFKSVIQDGCFYEYTTAYGVDDGEDFYIYLPGSKLADLPEGYRNWVGYHSLDTATETELPFYGLYNRKADCGFSSSGPVSVYAHMKEQIKKTEQLTSELENTLYNETLTQGEMNELAAQIYSAWDDTLNYLWKNLKNYLDEVSMAELTVKERAWISEKEKAVQAAAAEFEGGSMAGMILSVKGAELTRERVYELMNDPTLEACLKMH